ncbi:MAG: hypothetical protein JWN67_556 [Actinomycetia bacterium]|nr:hypothetical protein [Actinomycetes bacterium]
MALVALPLLGATLTACTPPPPRVLVLGDSISSEVRASSEATHWLDQSSNNVDWSGTRFMSAPCNGLRALRDLKYVPDVVIINYIGNNFSFSENCMNGEQGQALVDRYLRDLGAIGRALKNGHTRISIVGSPAHAAHRADSDAIFTAYKKFATDHHLTFVDGGAYLTPDRVPVRTAACLKRETGRYCGTTGGPGRNIIRDKDLEHLCPGPIDVYSRCQSYSSGAVRLGIQFGVAIDKAVLPHQ